jgi:hypothetical protein
MDRIQVPRDSGQWGERSLRAFWDRLFECSTPGVGHIDQRLRFGCRTHECDSTDEDGQTAKVCLPHAQDVVTPRVRTAHGVVTVRDIAPTNGLMTFNVFVGRHGDYRP